MNRIVITLEGEEREYVKHCLDKEIRLLTLKLDNGYFNKQRPDVQKQLQTLKRVRNRL